MKKIDLFYGMVFGMITGAIGVVLFIVLATDYTIIDGLTTLNNNGSLNKIIALGEVLNIPLVYFLLNKNKYLMTRGVILQALLISIASLFI